MPACEICGAQHEVLDPTFRYPEAWVRLDDQTRERHGRVDSDLCGIALPGEAPRHFVRGLISIRVDGLPDGVCWGVWAELGEEAFQRIVALWSDPKQVVEPPFDGVLANILPSYPDTRGLPLTIHLTGTSTRPEFRLLDGTHPFVREVVEGVDLHRAAQWNRLLSGGGAV